MRLGKARVFRTKRRAAFMPHKRRLQPFRILPLLLLCIFFYLMLRFFVTVRPMIATLAESKAKNLATVTIHKTVGEVLKREQVTYDSIVTIVTGDGGNVTAVTANTVEINRLKAEIAEQVEAAVSKIDAASIGFPLGNVFGNEFLSGLGPMIRISLLPSGSATVDFESSFSAAGINQTKHRIFLTADVDFSIMIQGVPHGTSVKTTIPVAETIIVGAVPESYTNIDGTTDSPADVGVNMLGG